MRVKILFNDETELILNDVYAVEKINDELQIKQLTNRFMFHSTLFEIDEIKNLILNVYN